MGWGGGWSESSFSPITNRHSSPCHTAPPSRVSPEFLVESAIKRRIFDNNCAGYLVILIIVKNLGKVEYLTPIQSVFCP